MEYGQYSLVAAVFCVVVGNIRCSVVPMQGNGAAPQMVTKSTEHLPPLPGSWNKVCTNTSPFVSPEYLTSLSEEVRDTILQVSCTRFPAKDALLFTELREWMRHLDRKVAVQVLCPTDGILRGEINLPWPMKAQNLVWLQVDGCTVKEYYAEYVSSEMTTIPDELRYLDLRNLHILFDPFQIPDLVRNSSFSSSDVECGPVTVEKLAMSNITMQIDLQESSWEKFENLTQTWDIGNLFETTMSNFNNLNHTCNFTKLRSIDDSYSLSQSKQQAYFLTAKSLFPEVRVYNISHSGLKVVPEELQNWSEHFPRLTIFDLSYNYISVFVISDLSPSWRSEEIYINLQYNNITTLTTSFLERAMNMSKVSIDLRNNPVLTDCSLFATFAEKLENETLSDIIAKSNLSYILQSPCSTTDPFSHDSTEHKAMSATESLSHNWLYAFIPVGIMCGIAAVLLTLFIRSRKVRSKNVNDKVVLKV